MQKGFEAVADVGNPLLADQHRRLRDRVLFDFAIDSKLRGCDDVNLRIGDIVSGGRVRDRAIVVQQKTKRPVQFELMESAHKTMRAWLERRGRSIDDYVFPSRNDCMAHMSKRQYARLVHEWVKGIGLQLQEYGTHSLRRTKASIIYKATGNPRAVQILLGHVKIDSTVRHLGVDIEDALELAERTAVQKTHFRRLPGCYHLLNFGRSFMWNAADRNGLVWGFSVVLLRSVERQVSLRSGQSVG